MVGFRLAKGESEWFLTPYAIWPFDTVAVGLSMGLEPYTPDIVFPERYGNMRSDPRAVIGVWFW